MKKVRSTQSMLFVLLMLTVVSFGCKRGNKGPGDGAGELVDPTTMSTDGLPGGEEFRPTGPGEDASAVLKTIYFDYDKADVRPDQQSILDGNADWLKQNADAKIQIEGHSDERGTNEYNFSLGDRRAKAVRSYLIERGIDGSRITTTSMGEEAPVASGSNEEAYAQNRRGLFKFAQ